MQKQVETLFENQFEEDVYVGLTDYPKHLSSKYFYDKKGDSIFQEIMHMPEYYLTDSEFEILEHYKHEISDAFIVDNKGFDLLELGAGDGKKTKILLKHLSEQKLDFTYKPIDISQNVLDQLEASLDKDLPDVQVETVQGTYLEALQTVGLEKGRKKVILFLGSNIGNLLHTQAIDFLKEVQMLMNEDDLFLVGFDQKKHPQTILNAYNDKAGITAKFNKNLLARVNAELDGNFDIDQFLHWEVYDPETGTAKSFLVSKKAQRVRIQKLNLNIDFKAWETIHTEISQKYDDQTIQWLAEKSGLQIASEFVDLRGYYKNVLFKK